MRPASVPGAPLRTAFPRQEVPPKGPGSRPEAPAPAPQGPGRWPAAPALAADAHADLDADGAGGAARGVAGGGRP